jgi:hypothetical protein
MLFAIVDDSRKTNDDSQDEGTCVDYKVVPKLERECSSFRGAVSPSICIEKHSEELVCVRYETL